MNFTHREILFTNFFEPLIIFQEITIYWKRKKKNGLESILFLRPDQENGPACLARARGSLPGCNLGLGWESGSPARARLGRPPSHGFRTVNVDRTAERALRRIKTATRRPAPETLAICFFRPLSLSGHAPFFSPQRSSSERPSEDESEW